MSKVFSEILLSVRNFIFFQQKYSAGWDSIVKEMIENWNVTSVDEYTITFAKGEETREVWIGNRFYSYGYLYRANGEYVPIGLWNRPSVKAMLKIDEIVSSENDRKLHEVMKKLFP